MEDFCLSCRGRGFCGKPCRILAELKKFQPKVKKEFSGSAPEIFVGKYNYPSIFAGILSPEFYGSTEELSMPEIWHEKQLDIQTILNHRFKLIYSRFKTNVKKVRQANSGKLIETMQEISMASKPVATEFKLKKEPSLALHFDQHTAIIGNPAFVEKARLEENPHIEKKVDYFVSDHEVKATEAINELYKNKIEISNIIKLLSAGILGLKIQRKLVPTRWAVTVIDDVISKALLQNIRTLPQINEYYLFSANYLGNYYNIILMPGPWSFEVIEASYKAGKQNKQDLPAMWHDYELFFGRKNYASDVTGAYYANRLGVCEYLEKIKRQASCLVLREVRDEYWVPLGVGILREVTREAMNKGKKFLSLKETLERAQQNFKLPLEFYMKKSKILEVLKKQKRLAEFF